MKITLDITKQRARELASHCHMVARSADVNMHDAEATPEARERCKMASVEYRVLAAKFMEACE